jgi:hypothetical protein
VSNLNPTYPSVVCLFDCGLEACLFDRNFEACLFVTLRWIWLWPWGVYLIVALRLVSLTVTLRLVSLWPWGESDCDLEVCLFDFDLESCLFGCCLESYPFDCDSEVCLIVTLMFLFVALRLSLCDLEAGLFEALKWILLWPWGVSIWLWPWCMSIWLWPWVLSIWLWLWGVSDCDLDVSLCGLEVVSLWPWGVSLCDLEVSLFETLRWVWLWPWGVSIRLWPRSLDSDDALSH